MLADPIDGHGDTGLVSTDVDGRYTIPGLSPGDFRLSFGGPFESNFLYEYYDDATDPATATPVGVEAGQTTTGIDAVLTEGGSISGLVTDPNGEPVNDVSVLIWRIDGDGTELVTDGTRGDGRYTARKLAPGEYRSSSRPPFEVTVIGEHYDNTTDVAAATVVSVTPAAR